MKIIFGNREDMDQLGDSYTVLELDSLRFPGSPVPQTAWCIIGTEDVTLQDLPVMAQFRDLHNNMMRNYRQKNWKFCEDAIEHLMGKWRGELDTFYVEIASRIGKFKQQDPGPDWDGVYEKQA